MDITKRNITGEIDDITASQFSGQFLIAAPSVHSDFFDRSVIYVCAHSTQGAMGFQINKPSQVTFAELMDATRTEEAGEAQIVLRHSKEKSVLCGGPVDEHRGFVLHTNDYLTETTEQFDDGICLTASVEILKAISAGNGPSNDMITLGYSGWSDGQLEQEIADNAWLIAKADHSMIFANDHEAKYIQALGIIGVKPENLVGYGGRA